MNADRLMEIEPAGDIDLDTPDDFWNRLRCGLLNEPPETRLDYPAMLILLVADAVIAAEENRWYNFGLDGDD